ncbi:hypothetical protein [Streptomyces malaysiensis]|uniref:ABM domain-containing protein n=1 Tax=Streptomyces malaysiensis subsp. samsunensis TaxID=459658 RepID=A0A9X2LZ37_STRMQ|nr:hypothetical protein [Streptomyces samsunensis]MCQ8832163.1 hypothetical protein [Streptomyces samsunensis]
MNGTGLFTMLFGRLDDPTPARADIGQGVACYTTDERLLLLLPGRRPDAAAAMATAMRVQDPTISVCSHDGTVTALPNQPTFTCEATDRYRAWITLATTAEELRPLVNYNIAETVLEIRHLPGFISASFLVQFDEPVLHEFVEWETRQHLEAAQQDPRFARHLPRIAAVATADFHSLSAVAPSRAWAVRGFGDGGPAVGEDHSAGGLAR